jgi:hypothetical protein
MYFATVSDWRVWDSLDPALYFSARRQTVSPAALSQPSPFAQLQVTIKPRNPATREQGPSHAVYTGGRRRWCLPVQNLPKGFYCKPGDIIQSLVEDGSRWVVQTADLRTRATWWLLDTLNLVIVANLSETVQIERAVLSYDSAGYPVKTFPPNGGKIIYQDLPASVQPITEITAEQRGVRAFQGDYVVTVGRQVDVQFDDRVVWVDFDGNVQNFDVIGTHNPLRIDQFQQLDCQRRV